MAGLKPYEITNENGFTTTLLLSEHDAKRRGLTEAAKPKPAKPARRRAAPKPANKQAPAPQDKAASEPAEDGPAEKADATGFEAFETTTD